MPEGHRWSRTFHWLLKQKLKWLFIHWYGWNWIIFYGVIVFCFSFWRPLAALPEPSVIHRVSWGRDRLTVQGSRSTGLNTYSETNNCSHFDINESGLLLAFSCGSTVTACFFSHAANVSGPIGWLCPGLPGARKPPRCCILCHQIGSCRSQMLQVPLMFGKTFHHLIPCFN